MKVKISNYPSILICNLYKNYMSRKYESFNWPANSTKLEHAISAIDDAIQAVYDVINRAWFDRREQRVRVKIDPWDVYSMDTTLAHIVLPMLKKLKDVKAGAPFTDDKDVPVEIRSTSAKRLTKKQKENGETDEYWFDRWNWILDEMIFAFDSKVGAGKDWSDQFHSGVYDTYFEKCDDGSGFSEMQQGPNHTAEFDYEGYMEYQKRIENGFRLFGKYYEALWW